MTRDERFRSSTFGSNSGRQEVSALFGIFEREIRKESGGGRKTPRGRSKGGSSSEQRKIRLWIAPLRGLSRHSCREDHTVVGEWGEAIKVQEMEGNQCASSPDRHPSCRLRVPQVGRRLRRDSDGVLLKGEEREGRGKNAKRRLEGKQSFSRGETHRTCSAECNLPSKR